MEDTDITVINDTLKLYLNVTDLYDNVNHHLSHNHLRDSQLLRHFFLCSSLKEYNKDRVINVKAENDT